MFQSELQTHDYFQGILREVNETREYCCSGSLRNASERVINCKGKIILVHALVLPVVEDLSQCQILKGCVLFFYFFVLFLP